jgi:hypothetical protein
VLLRETDEQVEALRQLGVEATPLPEQPVQVAGNSFAFADAVRAQATAEAAPSVAERVPALREMVRQEASTRPGTSGSRRSCAATSPTGWTSCRPSPACTWPHTCANRRTSARSSTAPRTPGRVEDLRSYYGDGPGEPGLALGYGAIELDSIEPGPRRLAACWP